MSVLRSVVARGRSGARGLAAMSPVRLHAEPDFLIIGAQKAGTSSLYQWLTSHPDVIRARTKELHYFDTRTVGSDTYILAKFPLASED